MQQNTDVNGNESSHVLDEDKKPYDTPHLAAHGTVEKLTKSIGVVPLDGFTGSAF